VHQVGELGGLMGAGDTIRLKLLKIGAAVRISVRRIWISMASSFPLQEMFVDVLRRLESLPLRC
jgi:hypothetical protein